MVIPNSAMLVQMCTTTLQDSAKIMMVVLYPNLQIYQLLPIYLGVKLHVWHKRVVLLMNSNLMINNVCFKILLHQLLPEVIISTNNVIRLYNKLTQMPQHGTLWLDHAKERTCRQLPNSLMRVLLLMMLLVRLYVPTIFLDVGDINSLKRIKLVLHSQKHQK